MSSTMLMAAAALSQVFQCTTNSLTGFALDTESNEFSSIMNSNPVRVDVRLVIEGNVATVEWREISERRLSGTQEFHKLSNGSTKDLNMVFSSAEGPCVQSTSSCGALLNLVKNKDGSMAFILASTQAVTNVSTNADWPAMGVLHGICPSSDNRQ